MKHSRNTFLVAAFPLVILLQGCGANSDIEDAQASFLKFQEEIAAMNEAVQAQDSNAATQHEGEAVRLLQGARYSYEKGGAAESRDPVILAGYGDTMQQLGEYDIAAKAYQRAAGAFPEDPTLWFNLGNALSNIGESKALEAKRAFEKCVALEPEPVLASQALSNLGDVFRKMGLHEIAAQYYQQAVDTYPENVNTHIVLAAMKAREGLIKESSDRLDSLGVIPPQYGPLMQQNLQAALMDFQNARLWIEDTPQDHMAYAKLLLRAGRNAECIPALERSLELDDQNYIGWNILGSISNQLRDTTRARQAFQKSLQLNPVQPRTQQALDALGPQTPASIP